MKRFVLPKVIFYPIVVLVLAVVSVGMWFTWQAQEENHRLGIALNQVLRVVERARGVRLSVNISPIILQNRLIDALVRDDHQQETVLPPTGLDQGPVKALINPWGRVLKIKLFPSLHKIRLESAVSSNNCRRMLAFYVHEIASLGLQRVDVMQDPTYDLWGLVYDEKRQLQGSQGLSDDMMRKGCGKGLEPILALTFNLP